MISRGLVLLASLVLSLALEHVRRTYSWAKNGLPMLHRLPLVGGLISRLTGGAMGCTCGGKAPVGLPFLSPVTRLSPRVVRVLGCNPGKFTLSGTNTFLVGTGKARLLVDTGEGRPEYLAALKEAMVEHGVEKIDKILITHRHYDHLGGIKSLYQMLGEQPPTFKSMNAGGHWDAYKYNAHVPEDIPWRHIDDGQEFEVEGATLKAVFTPGHSEDHMCFLLEQDKALFAGDNVLGCGTSWFEDLGDYMSSLDTMLRLCKGHGGHVEVLHTGHGPSVLDAASKLTEYIDHRTLRERQILDVLTTEAPHPLTSLQITRRVYPKLPFFLFFAANSNVLNHLGKLEAEARVKRMLWGQLWGLGEGQKSSSS